MDSTANANCTRILRAVDVMPPFDADDTSRRDPSREGLPTFDLADSILAEQRRMASAKRRRAVRPDEPAKAVIKEPPPAPAAPREPAAPDAAELHHVVAGIVARDIERLCAGPVPAGQL